MTPRRTVVTVLLPVLLAVGGAGCGSDEEERPTATRQQFAQNADRVCRDLTMQGQRFVQQLSQSENPPDIYRAIDFGIRANRDAVRRLRALPRPEGADGELATRFVDSAANDVARRSTPRLEAVRTAVQNGDRRGAERAFETLARNETTESDRLARQLGARACAT